MEAASLPFNPSDPALVINDLLSARASLADVAVRHDTEIGPLCAFLLRPDVQARLLSAHSVIAQAVRIAASLHITEALDCLVKAIKSHTAAAESPLIPDTADGLAHRQAAHANARRAAAQLFRFATFRPIAFDSVGTFPERPADAQTGESAPERHATPRSAFGVPPPLAPAPAARRSVSQSTSHVNQSEQLHQSSDQPASQGAPAPAHIAPRVAPIAPTDPDTGSSSPSDRVYSSLADLNRSPPRFRQVGAEANNMVFPPSGRDRQPSTPRAPPRSA